jgi:hypothetical protein
MRLRQLYPDITSIEYLFHLSNTRRSSLFTCRGTPGIARLVLSKAETSPLPDVCDVLHYRCRIGAIEIFLDSSYPTVRAPRAQHAWHFYLGRICTHNVLLHEAIIESYDPQLLITDTLYMPAYPGQRADAIFTCLIHPIVGVPKSDILRVKRFDCVDVAALDRRHQRSGQLKDF